MPPPCFEPQSGCVAVPAESALTLVVCARLPMFPVCIRTRGFFRTCAVDRLDEMFNWEYGGMNGDGGSHHTRMARGVGPQPLAPHSYPAPLLPRGRRDSESCSSHDQCSPDKWCKRSNIAENGVRPSCSTCKLCRAFASDSIGGSCKSRCADPTTKPPPQEPPSNDDADDSANCKMAGLCNSCNSGCGAGSMFECLGGRKKD